MYFSEGLKSLATNGIKNWNKLTGSFKGGSLKSKSGNEISSLYGTVTFLNKDVKGTTYHTDMTAKWAMIIDNCRKNYGSEHNHRYPSLKEMNFTDVVSFNQSDVETELGKNISKQKYSGLKIIATAKQVEKTENWLKIEVSISVEMIPISGLKESFSTFRKNRN